MADVRNENEQKVKHDTEDLSEENMTMSDLLGPDINIEEGKVISVKVMGENPDGFIIDLGLKSEGMIPRSDLTSAQMIAEVQVGTEIKVVVEKLHDESGHPILSYRKAREMEYWNKISAASNNVVPIKGTVSRKVKGGLIVDIGIDAFLPASQIELRFVKDIDIYIGKEMEFMIAELDQEKRNVVLSRKKLLEIEQKEKRYETLENLKEGNIVEGRVTGITAFGAFVDIGGVDGLLHISDISWKRTTKVTDVITVGQRVKVKILKIEGDKSKISLGMKQVTPKPWESVAQKYKVESVIKGKVSSITDFGAFVELEPGIEGLMHISEIFWDGRKEDLKKTFSVGQELEVKIISIDTEKEKISLSLKRIQPNPWDEAKLSYPANAKVKGVVSHLTPFGAFVKLPGGVEGLIHVSDMSWIKKVRQPQDFVKVGQEVEAVVLDVNSKNEKISLSLKHLTEDPFLKYRSGVRVKGKVTHITDFGAFVEIEPGVDALVRLSEIESKKIESPAEGLKVGQEIEAKIIKSDPRERKLEISIKKLEHELERELLRKYANKSQSHTLGDLLEEE